ncbi:hypothetical protein HQ520_04675 [bacterium]|nr:hypothetical protein [bacterium]
MVDAYATTLGKLTLAINQERFLLEDPDSNSILSLQPAFMPAGATRPSRPEGVAGFATLDRAISVTWQPVSGIQAETSLVLEDAGRLRLETRFTNVSSQGILLASLFPLRIPVEGPGACALGLHDLRTLASRRPGRAPRLVGVQGDALWNSLFGACFARSGSPMLLLGPLSEGPSCRFRVEGARGKVAGLDVECDAGDKALAPGDVVSAPPLRLVIGNFEIREELQDWAEHFGNDRVLELLEGFSPSAEIVEEEPEEELAEPEAELTEPACEGDTPVGEAAAGDGNEEEHVGGSDPEEDTATVLDSAAFQPSARASRDRLPRTATFRRALRVNEGIWPRWASARRHPTLTGTSARGRQHWKRQPGEAG